MHPGGGGRNCEHLPTTLSSHLALGALALAIIHPITTSRLQVEPAWHHVCRCRAAKLRNLQALPKMTSVKLNQQLKRVEISDLSIENDVVFSYFDQLLAKDRVEALFRAIYMGVLAQLEDRLASFLARTESELGARLEGLKQIFEMKKEIFYKSSVKGAAAEEDIAAFLQEFVERKGWKDEISLTGAHAGLLARNKTGDIVSEVDRKDDRRIAIECKFDKSIRFGEIEKKDVSARRSDTVWSQLLESSVNRSGRASIIVLDSAMIDASVLSKVESVGYIKHVGFIAIVDSQSGNYSNLAIAYSLARDIVLGAIDENADPTVLAILVRRLLSDLDNYASIKRDVGQIVAAGRNILLKMNRSLLMVQFAEEYLYKFLNEGGLSKQDLLDFYMAEDVREKYGAIEKEIFELVE